MRKNHVYKILLVIIVFSVLSVSAGRIDYMMMCFENTTTHFMKIKRIDVPHGKLKVLKPLFENQIAPNKKVLAVHGTVNKVY